METTNTHQQAAPPAGASPGIVRTGNPKRTARIVLGILLGLNLVGALLLLEFFGGSPEGLEANARRLESQLQQQRNRLQQSRVLAAKMQTGGAEGAKFIGTYFLDERQAAGDLLKALDAIETQAGVRGKGKNFTVDAIEGTDEYQLLTIDAGYEASYADLVEFVSAVDHSERLLILDSLQVAPARDDLALQVQAKMFAFIKHSNLAASAQGVKP
jgi:Tfp pilus assembly protein PilO